MKTKKVYRFNNGFIGTIQDAINNDMFVKSSIDTVPAIEFNRVKYNRMNAREQEIYEKRLKD
ncbi:hypothetical protein EOM09_07410, partial [bacterium]|nr:hypothetical protein [bacterium]